MAEEKREVADRPGDAYNNLSVYIKMWVGGLRKLRVLLGQEHVNTTEWTRADAIEAYRSLYERQRLRAQQSL
jgi:hypothetical protein